MTQTTWSVEQVLALAPDASSAQSAKGLAKSSKWSGLGQSDRAVWGECQGSGKSPYQTRIDLSEPAFKCSCPSRKFPCKHGLALFLLLAQNASLFASADPPDWVTSWLEGRQERAKRQEAKASRPAGDAMVDEQAQAKRAAKREERVAAGLADLKLWMNDLVRGGLANAQSKPYSYWESMAARMVDAQAPGVGRLLRSLPSIASSGEGWPEKLLWALGRIHLLVEAYSRLETLPEPLREEVRMLVGWAKPKEEVLSQPAVRDRWGVLGQVTEFEDRLLVRRSWLHGLTSGRMALELSFAAPGQAFDSVIAPGMLLEADLVFYPSPTPLRALIKETLGTAPSIASLGGALSISKSLEGYRATLAQNPWIEHYPMLLKEVSVCPREENRNVLLDAESYGLPVDARFRSHWQLISAAAGRPVTIFGEWDGQALLPLSAFDGTSFSPFSLRPEA